MKRNPLYSYEKFFLVLEDDEQTIICMHVVNGCTSVRRVNPVTQEIFWDTKLEDVDAEINAQLIYAELSNKNIVVITEYCMFFFERDTGKIYRHIPWKHRTLDVTIQVDKFTLTYESLGQTLEQTFSNETS